VEVVCLLYSLPLFAWCFPGTSSRPSVMSLSRELSTKKLRVTMLFCQCGRGRLLGKWREYVRQARATSWSSSAVISIRCGAGVAWRTVARCDTVDVLAVYVHLSELLHQLATSC